MLFFAAVVSVKPDYTASAVQAATGQPLLAQSQQQQYIQFIPQLMPPQPTGYQMGQVSCFMGFFRIYSYVLIKHLYLS
jgi:hypothetical protein